MGLGLRAVADDPGAASSIGIPLNNIMLLVWTAAGVVALVAGMMWGARAGVQFALVDLALKALPVLIIGGGLSGLASALFLAKHNIEYLLIERHLSTAIHPKAGGITFRTMELFRELGLEQRIRSICESSSELEIKLLKEDIEDFNKFLSRHQKNSTNIWMGILISDSVNEIKPINYD